MEIKVQLCFEVVKEGIFLMFPLRNIASVWQMYFFGNIQVIPLMYQN